MKMPPHLASDTEHRWLSTSEARVHFGRSQATISKWITNGTCVEFGLKLYRDITGHYWIGVEISENFSKTIPSATASLL